MRKVIMLLLLFISQYSFGQELYVFTEPASNMAAKSIGLRLNNFLVENRNTSSINYHLIPEVMFGISKKIMMHGDVFFSNNNKNFSPEGGSVYAKYRFLSNDDIQTHFRIAAFGRVSFNNSKIDQEEINIYGYNSGWEGGVVATQLLHKVALSSSASFIKATDNGSSKFPTTSDKAINYTLSIGKLMLPKEYKNYKQTNLNLLVEFLNQFNLGSGKNYFDIAPSVQLIFNSQSRIDVGYRQELASTYKRTSPNGFFVRLEHNIFNAW